MAKEKCDSCDQDLRKKKGYICTDVNYEDNLPFRCVHKQSYLKLDLLQYYLEIFCVAMHNKQFTHINFLDLFSGPGICYNRDTGEFREGSSLISLNLRYPFSNYVFVDSNVNTSDALRKRCYKLNKNMVDRIKILNLNSNDNISEILQNLPLENSITVAFLDPNAFDIDFNVYRRLSEYSSIDLIINFAKHDLIRNKAIYKNGTSIKGNRGFGCSDWPEKEREWLPFFKSKLSNLGFVALEDDLELKAKIKTTSQTDIYYLIYASKNKLGLKFWREAKKKYVSNIQGDFFEN